MKIILNCIPVITNSWFKELDLIPHTNIIAYYQQNWKVWLDIYTDWITLTVQLSHCSLNSFLEGAHSILDIKRPCIEGKWISIRKFKPTRLYDE